MKQFSFPRFYFWLVGVLTGLCLCVIVTMQLLACKLELSLLARLKEFD